ncbi:MAG: SUMF1/EgtB/PvdO family nonheme iron enzyme [Bacteroidetes bacterium]|nr:SUMF1/EgtB/PvdO family nonheme iron enzyme [Bacteroidota bacterium]
MLMYHRLINVLSILLVFVIVTSCNILNIFKKRPETSHSTGWAFDTEENGGFSASELNKQETGPGLIFIEGGTFVMGSTQENVLREWNNIPRRITVPSFYIDETEVSNLDYLEYLYWTARVFGKDHPEVYRRALPDTLVWRARLAYNEPLVNFYLRHPAYQDYPVVGVSWVQANEYCLWRTNRVNELLLINAGALNWDINQKNENNFNLDAYQAGQYGPESRATDSLSGDLFTRVSIEDGILLPDYRLPTEAEWEYAALGLLGNTINEQIVERRTYPWNGHYIRTGDAKYQGSFMANFKRGRGDYMGVAGYLNDGASITAPVGSYWPNDYGLYNMAGNVSEWVSDVYRPLSMEDVADYSPFRGNVFMNKQTDSTGIIVQKDSLGRIPYIEVTDEESKSRRNYRHANNINYRDGDKQSLITTDWLNAAEFDNQSLNTMYNYGVSTLISDQARVYKGGSWKDPAYFLSPSVRRFLDQNEAANFIGFRCAMVSVGPTSSQGE